MIKTLPLITAAAIATAAPRAQQTAPASQPASLKQQLHQAFKAMDSLPSYRVTRNREKTGGTVEGDQIRAIFAPNRIAAEMDRAAVTTWTPDLLFATADEGREHIVQRGRRTIARMGDDGAWRLRKQRFARGSRAPQPIDPTILFDVLQDMDLEIKPTTSQSVPGADTQSFSVALIPEQAGELVWSGALPHVDDVFLPGAAPGTENQNGSPKSVQWPQGSFALCITIDKKTRWVQEIRARVAEVENVKVTVNGGEGDVEVQPTALKDGSREFDRFNDGLPPLETNGQRITLYTWTFSEHGAARPMVLDQRAKQLLRMGR